MSLMDEVKHLKRSFEEIKLATNNFGDTNFIGRGGFGKVYIGTLNTSGQLSTVAVKRLDPVFGQGDREFSTEIQMLSFYRHKNLVSLVGFCDEGGEKILVYNYEKNRSLDKHLSDTKLSWIQRLQVSIGIAHGLNYLHNDVGPQHRVVHRDIKSSNILLSENWEAKISDFGLSKVGPSNVKFTSLFTRACGTKGYIDPQYEETEILTKETDVYAFGVVLFEILCGRLAYIEQYKDERRSLGMLAQRYYNENRLHEIIPPHLFDQMNVDLMEMFTMVANQCLAKSLKERPTMDWIIEKLEKALKLQACSKAAGFVRVGRWGRQTGGSPWSFELEEGHNLQKITINYGDVIYSLTFTTISRGVLNTPNTVGGCASGDMFSEIMLDGDEEIIGINGTTGTRDGYTVISSLSFQTTNGTHGPFGRATGSLFSIPWDEGLLVGFYGLASNYVDAIGVYIKSSEKTIKLGTWGCRTAGPEYIWSFQLERNHHLKKITIGHGDLIYSLKFSTEYRGLMHNSEKAGGKNGEDKVSEVTFDWDEKIMAIKGTAGLSRGNNAGFAIISSLSFATNKTTHGPFGRTRGTPFTIPLEDGSFAGFYGHADYHINSIGVYLKATSNLCYGAECKTLVF